MDKKTFQNKLAQLQANGAQSGTNNVQEDPVRALRQAAVNSEESAMGAAHFSVE